MRWLRTPPWPVPALAERSAMAEIFFAAKFPADHREVSSLSSSINETYIAVDANEESPTLSNSVRMNPAGSGVPGAGFNPNDPNVKWVRILPMSLAVPGHYFFWRLATELTCLVTGLS